MRLSVSVRSPVSNLSVHARFGVFRALLQLLAILLQYTEADVLPLL